jgi:GNAT superfamily N-acetyltransferase
MSIEYRLATLDDVPALEALIPLSTRALQSACYSPAQLDGAIGTVFGVDTQLIKDGTYFVATAGGAIVGCGGWSRRKTLYGSDRAKTTEDNLRDPRTEPAMIRAFFVHPDFARRGIGREIMRRSETAALAAGFRAIEIIATLAGEPLYAACGYVVVERFEVPLANGLRLPVVRMKRHG